MGMENIENILEKLVNFPTVTGNAAEMRSAFEYIASLFDKLPVAIEYIEQNGVRSQIIYQKGADWKNADMVLSGHLDVVPAEENEFASYIKNGKLFGRGAADMKSGLAAMIVGFQSALRAKSKKNIVLLITADEEIGGINGVGHIVNDLGMRGKFALVLDGPRHEEILITTKEKGGAWIEILAKGKGGHAARPWLGENAIDKLSGAIEQIKQAIGPIEPNAWKTTYNVALVETTNKAGNVIPEEARAVIDVRFTEAFAKTPDALVAKLQKIVPEVALTARTKIALFRTSEKNASIKKLQCIATEVVGKKVEFGFGHGASDARYFAAQEIPAALLGPIGGNWHGRGEWVYLESVKKLAEIVRRFLED